MSDIKVVKTERGIIYYLDDRYHREDGPAIEWADGTKEWRLNGVPHREDGPAIERCNGDKLWYLNGKLHREDEPAVEYADGRKEWWINDKLDFFKTYPSEQGKTKIRCVKGMNNDMTCRGFQYEFKKTYSLDGIIELCRNGFHACPKVANGRNIVKDFYPVGRYFIVDLEGDMDFAADKMCARTITIIEEIEL